jgi:septal ring factor EnvC (AmiA/AmiB activator)
MSKRLEDFVKSNREQFDDLEPSAERWTRIEKHLPAEGAIPQKREAKMFSLSFVLKVAASVIIVMGVAFALYIRNEKSKGVDLASINPVYAKQQVQYASMVESKMSQLKTLTKNDPEMYKEFSKEIAKMDSTYKRLNRDLATSPNQEYVLKAMIRNLQIQTQVLNQQLYIIEQYNQMKKDPQNDTQDI